MNKPYHEIDKTFHFEYGHRVHNQSLDSKYSVDDCCICRHHHGHSAVVKTGLKCFSNDLSRGMVTDFKHLNIFKQFIDDYLDHKTILDIKDPLLDVSYPNASDNLIKHKDYEFYTVNPDFYKDLPGYMHQLYEGLVVVKFVPTSENISVFLGETLKKMLDGLDGFGTRFELAYVDFWETAKSHCRYTL